GIAATQVAAGILPAVELGFQPGGRDAPHAANYWEFSSNCPSMPRFRAAGCRPLRQPGWLPLRNSRSLLDCDGPDPVAFVFLGIAVVVSFVPAHRIEQELTIRGRPILQALVRNDVVRQVLQEA